MNLKEIARLKVKELDERMAELKTLYDTRRDIRLFRNGR